MQSSDMSVTFPREWWRGVSPVGLSGAPGSGWDAAPACAWGFMLISLRPYAGTLISMGFPYRSPGRTKATTVMMRAMVSGVSLSPFWNQRCTMPTSEEMTETR